MQKARIFAGDMFYCINSMAGIDIDKLSDFTILYLRLLGEKQMQQSYAADRTRNCVKLYM